MSVDVESPVHAHRLGRPSGTTVRPGRAQPAAKPKALITPEMKTAVEAAKAKIISGEIKVHDYTSDSTCPVS